MASGPTNLSCLANGDVVAAVLVVVVVAVEHGAQAGGSHLRLLGDPVPQHAPLRNGILTTCDGILVDSFIVVLDGCCGHAGACTQTAWKPNASP